MDSFDGAGIVLHQGGDNVIQGNIIAFNAVTGVGVADGSDNAILANSIYSNGGPGIDLDLNGVTDNDPDDADGGANRRQNFPVLQSATTGNIVSGILTSTPNTAFRIEFFLNNDCDLSGNGEGETFIGTESAQSDADGVASFEFAHQTAATPGQFITATATDPAYNTSEFGPCIAIMRPPKQVPEPGIITTVADGASDALGDGGPATRAGFDTGGIFVDRQGLLYIADRGNHRIRKVDEDGIITTVAGNGVRESSGDGGPAVEAGLGEPNAVFVTGGVLYISERFHRIRKVDEDGIITTVAGNGVRGFSGDGGPAVEATLNRPVDIFVDSRGNLFIADRNNHRVRKVDGEGIITTVAGNGVPVFSGDGGPAVEATLNRPVDISSTAPGISSSQTGTTIAFARWMKRASSRPSPATARRATNPLPTGRQPFRLRLESKLCSSTERATSTSPPGSGSTRSQRMALSLPSRATASGSSLATEDQRSKRASVSRATCS